MFRSIMLPATLLAVAISASPIISTPALSQGFIEINSSNGTAGIPYFGHKYGNFMSSSTEISILAVGGVVSGAAAVSSINNEDGSGGGSDTYRLYSGDGSAAAGWPAKEKWVSFRAMFDNNKPIMAGSCGWNGWGADNSASEIGDIYNAIQQVALETKVDHRFILAVMLQESGGCTRVHTTSNGVRNPGMMQCHNGDGTCNSDITGQVQNPCPSGVITQMIREGTAGTRDGDGLAQSLNAQSSGGSGSRAYYIAARLYNSGSVNLSNMNDAKGATLCYVTDIANRLTGWVFASHGC